MANNNNNNWRTTPSGNPFPYLNLGGSARQLPQEDTASQPPAPRPAPPTENPFLTMEVGGFAPVGSGRRRPPPAGPSPLPHGVLYTPPGMEPYPPARPAPTAATRPARRLPPPQAAPGPARHPLAPMPVVDAVNRLRDAGNLEPGARHRDGSVTISREWVTRVVGLGHMQRSPRTRIERFADHSAFQILTHEQLGLPVGFVDWMRNENGVPEITMPPAVAREMFGR